jgi:hypothetical protein
MVKILRSARTQHAEPPARIVSPLLAEPEQGITVASLLALQRSAGNQAVVQRLTTAEAYPQGQGSRYANRRNIETDVAMMDFGLAEGAKYEDLDDGPCLEVPVAAGNPVRVGVKFAGLASTAQYVPTQFTLDWTTKPPTVTVTVHAGVEKKALNAALHREFNEIVYRVRADAAGQNDDNAQAQRAVFVPGPTPANAVLTANDRATALELKAVWDAENGDAVEKKETARMRAVLAQAGLGAIQALPISDKKITALLDVGFKLKEIVQLQANREQSAFAQANAGVQRADVIFGAEEIAHLLRPRFPDTTFAGAGISGGHLESELLAFVAGHAELLLVPAGAAGGYSKYHQYRWTQGTPKPTTNLPVIGQPPPAGWELARDDDGNPIPKTTFTSIQPFLRDAITAFQSWTTSQPDSVTKKSNGEFGLKAPAALANGQSFGGWFKFEDDKWTLNTIFPLV